MAEKKIHFSELNEEQITAVSELFKVLGDYTRVRILSYLFESGSVPVGEIAEGLGMTVSAISHQLKILKQSKLVKGRRDGRQIYYSLDDEHVSLIIGMAIEHISHE